MNDGERSGEFVSEVLAALAKDGYREVLVQPLHLIPEFEYAKIEREAALRADSFERLVVGKPLLADDDDFPAVAEAIRPIAAALQKDQALLLMGHGSRHAANQAYECQGLFRRHQDYRGRVHSNSKPFAPHFH